MNTMYCFQCEEALSPACTRKGMCGKTPELACLQDLLNWQLKGISLYAVPARALDIVDAEIDLFVAEALFSTITNVNFDPAHFAELVKQAVTYRERLAARLQAVNALPADLPQKCQAHLAYDCPLWPALQVPSGSGPQLP